MMLQQHNTNTPLITEMKKHFWVRLRRLALASALQVAQETQGIMKVGAEVQDGWRHLLQQLWKEARVEQRKASTRPPH